MEIRNFFNIPLALGCAFAIYFVNNLQQSFKRYDNFCSARRRATAGNFHFHALPAQEKNADGKLLKLCKCLQSGPEKCHKTTHKKAEGRKRTTHKMIATW